MRNKLNYNNYDIKISSKCQEFFEKTMTREDIAKIKDINGVDSLKDFIEDLKISKITSEEKNGVIEFLFSNFEFKNIELNDLYKNLKERFGYSLSVLKDEYKRINYKETTSKASLEGKAIITYYEASISQTIKEIINALNQEYKSKDYRDIDKIYKFGGNLVNIINDENCVSVDGFAERKRFGLKNYIINNHNIDSLRLELEKIMFCQDEDCKPILIPNNVIRSLIEYIKTDNSFNNILTGMITVPFVNYDYELISNDLTYDNNTGLFQIINYKQDIKTKCHNEASDNPIEYPIEFLKDVYKDFYFMSELDQIAGISMLLCAIQRKLMDKCPGYLITSYEQQSGKSTLAETVSYIYKGVKTPTTSYYKNNEENAKSLLSLLMQGESLIYYDNVITNVLESEEISKIITNSLYSNRNLGHNLMKNVLTSSMFIFTGNGINTCGDFNSRMIRVELKSKEVSKNIKNMRKNFNYYLLENRENIINACLKLIIDSKGYEDYIPSRFPMWDKFVRVPLLKATGIDLIECFDNNNIDDEVKNSKEIFLSKLYELDNDKFKEEFTSKDLLEFIEKIRFFDTDEYDEIYDIFEDVFENINVKSIGKILKNMTGVNFEGFILNKIIGRAKTVYWKIEKIE